MVWLEIEDSLIVGVHSDRCDNDNQWVEYEGEAHPGDHWCDGEVVPHSQRIDIAAQKRYLARERIIRFYPEWKQLNTLREGDKREIKTMSQFIDACRKWSNDGKSALHTIESISP